MLHTWIDRSRTLGTVLAFLCAASVMAQDDERGGGPPQGVPADISVGSLIEEMADMVYRTRSPRFPHRLHQRSSADPRSKSGPGDKSAWFATNDSGNFLRSEKKGNRREWVLAEAQGPGAIVRIWTDSLSGRYRVYLDGSPVPAIDMEAVLAFTGQITIFGAPFSGRADGGYFIRFPIPYMKSMKVTCDADDPAYHVNWRAYSDSTKVKTFAMKEAIIATFQAGGAIGRMKSLSTTEVPDEENIAATRGPLAIRNIPAKGTHAFLDRKVKTPEAITSFSIQDVSGQVDPAAWRSLWLEMTFDGVTTVNVPLGDFFGGSLVHTPCAGIALQLKRDIGPVRRLGLVMPYRVSAGALLRNRGDRAVRSLVIRVKTEPYRWDEGRSLHFHAAFRSTGEVSSRPVRDWTVTMLNGPGIYVGDTLSYLHRGTGEWDQGGEKIWIDDDEFPSHFGTRLSAYFGSSPRRKGVFCTPFEGRLSAPPGMDGWSGVTMHRWRHLDAIPFERRFRLDYEINHADNTRLLLGAVCYWYAGAVAVQRLADEKSWRLPGDASPGKSGSVK